MQNVRNLWCWTSKIYGLGFITHFYVCIYCAYLYVLRTFVCTSTHLKAFHHAAFPFPEYRVTYYTSILARHIMNMKSLQPAGIIRRGERWKTVPKTSCMSLQVCVWCAIKWNGSSLVFIDTRPVVLMTFDLRRTRWQEVYLLAFFICVAWENWGLPDLCAFLDSFPGKFDKNGCKLATLIKRMCSRVSAHDKINKNSASHMHKGWYEVPLGKLQPALSN